MQMHSMSIILQFTNASDLIRPLIFHIIFQDMMHANGENEFHAKTTSQICYHVVYVNDERSKTALATRNLVQFMNSANRTSHFNE